MSAAITELSPQAAAIPLGTAATPAASPDGPQDAFMAMLVAVIDANAAPPVKGASPITIEGPAIAALPKAPIVGGTPPVPGALAAIPAKSIDPTQPDIPQIVPPPTPAPPPAVPDLAGYAPIPPPAPETAPPPPTNKASPAKILKPEPFSAPVEPDPVTDIAALTPAVPVAPPQLPNPPTFDMKPAAIASASTEQTVSPAPPPVASGVNVVPPPVDDLVKPRERTSDDPTPATADPPPEIVAQPMPLSAPAHHIPATETTIVHVLAAPLGAPPTPAIAGQAGAAFVVLAREGDGTHHLTLLLQPPDLGELRITVEQSKDSPARIAVTAANSSTLLTLLRDQPALNQALDSAGISSDGRVLTFHLADRDLAPVVATQPSQNPGDAAQSQGGGQNAGLSGQSPQTQSGAGGHGRQDQHPARHEPPARGGFADMTQIEQSPPPTRATLTAIDITA